MAFDAGAITGKVLLDKSKWDSATQSIKASTDQMKSKFSSFTSSLKSNWIAATAAITASIMVINKAWNLMELGAKAKQVEDSFMAMTKSAGIAGQELEKSLAAASGYTTNLSNIASAVSTLIGQKLNPEQITSLMQIARAEARKTGEDVTSAFNRISQAVSGGFLRSLKATYGLNVDATVAIENYARQMGLTKDQVERFYKAQAMANEVIKASARDVNALSSANATYYERILQVKAAWNDFIEKLGFGLLNFVSIIGDLAGMLFSSIAGSYDLIASAFYKVLSFIPGLKNAMNAASDELMKKSQANAAMIQSYWKDMSEGVKVAFGGTKDAGVDMNGVLQENSLETTAVVKQTFDDWLKDTRQNFNAMLLLGQGTFEVLSSSFSNLFYDAFTGDLKSAKEAFADFGRSLLKMMFDIVAKWLAMKAIMGIVNAVSSVFGGASSASSGLNSTMSVGSFNSQGLSLGSFAEGTESVPSTGLYKVHEGEKITPKYDANKSGVIELTVINQITPGFVNAAIATEPGTVINVINQDTLFNRSTRRTQRISVR